MSELQILELGYSLELLPFSSSECASGGALTFQLRLEVIKEYLKALGLMGIYNSLDIFEELLASNDPATFINQNYDKFNVTRDVCSELVHNALTNEENREIFKLGMALGQHQLYIVTNTSLKELTVSHLLIKMLLNNLLENIMVPETTKNDLVNYQNNTKLTTLGEVIELKEKISQWFQDINFGN